MPLALCRSRDRKTLKMMKEMNTAEAGSPGSALARVLGRWDLTAIGVNQLIGSGIFVLPASIALLVGAPASPLVWVAAGVANALIVLCFAEAAARFKDAGGPYLYARKAFGPFVGFEVAWMIWLTRVASQAALANALTLYLGFFWAPRYFFWQGSTTEESVTGPGPSTSSHWPSCCP